MIPILFPPGEENFTSNGLGRLADATDCTAIEERNGAYELTMTYPITGVHFSDITHSKIIYAKPADGKDPQPFRIYYIGKPLNGITEIKAEHISYQMTHIPVKPFTAQNASGALAGLEFYAAEECPFTFWTDKSTTAAFKVEVPSSMRSLLGGQQGSILDAYGGEWEFDGYTAKLHNNRGQDKGVTLQYGKNITDIKQEENISTTYTGVMPYWKGTSTEEADTEEVLVTLPEGVLHSANAANFPYQRTIPLDMSGDFENPPTVERLRGAANSYMTANDIGIPHVSINVSFVALWQTEEYKDIANLERVNLCDTVTVQFEKLGISVKAKVVKTEYDVLRERYKSIEVGNTTTNLARSLIDDMTNTVNGATGRMATKSFLQKSVERATKLLSGGLGGYVILNTNADGQPEEILVMDKPSTDTASKVIRINKNGIGFSTTGYDGQYRTAWTIDGHFVADFIDSGNLNANLIRSGTLLADYIRLHGLMAVYERSEPGASVGGYVGYGSGRVSDDETTDGIMLSNTNNIDENTYNTHYLIATEAGARMTAGNTSIYTTDNEAHVEADGDIILKGKRIYSEDVDSTIDNLPARGWGTSEKVTIGNGYITTVNGLVTFIAQVGGANVWDTDETTHQEVETTLSGGEKIKIVNGIVQNFTKSQLDINKELNDQQTGIKPKLSTVETDVNTLKTDVNTLKTDVNTLKTDINDGTNGLKKKMEDIERRVKAIEDSINNGIVAVFG